MSEQKKFFPCVIVHGGAFNVPESYVKRYTEGTQAAAKAGYQSMLTGGNALDAAEAAVNSLENNSAFNAGRGSVLTEAGTVECDAVIVDGTNRKTGAVGCVRDIANPVSLARKVMEETPHCMLVGEGAMKFAQKIQYPILENPQDLITNDSVHKSFMKGSDAFDAHIKLYIDEIVQAKGDADLKKMFEEIISKEKVNKKNGHDTVGAVAIDKEGNLACATSTGGLPGKMLGRVGDSPIFGAGAYGDKNGCSSSTGHGEPFLKAAACRQANYFLEQGNGPMEACQKTLDYILEEIGYGHGGIILIDKKGEIGYAFNTATMAWASVSDAGMRYGMRPGEDFTVTL